MKFYSAILILLITTAALADVAEISADGKTVSTRGMSHGIGSEVLAFVSDAHDIGYKDEAGNDIFTKQSARRGSGGMVRFNSKNVSVVESSGVALNFIVNMSGNPGDFGLTKSGKVLTVKGKAADVLFEAMKLALPNQGPARVGVSMHKTASGKVVCSRPVVLNPKNSCTISL